MVKYFLYLVISVLVSLQANVVLAAESAQSFTASIDRSSQVYGKEILYTLRRKLDSAPFSTTMLEDLSSNFSYTIIDKIFSEDEERWVISLIPRRVGELTIPALAVGTVHSNELLINCLPATSINADGDIELVSSISSPSALEKQQIIISVSITTADKFTRFNADEFLSKDFEAYQLVTQVKQTTINGTLRFSHLLRWSVFGLKQGQYNLALPSIEYIKNGVVEYKFATPVFPVTINALPTYIPPTLTIGKVNVTEVATTTELELPLTNKISTRRIRVTGDGVPSKWLPVLTDKFSYQPGTTVVAVMAEDKNILIGNELRGQRIYTINYLVNDNGLTRLDAITYRFFDPAAKKLVLATLPSMAVFALDKVPLLALVIFTLGLLMYGMVKIVTFLKRHYDNYRAKKMAIKQLLMAEKAEQVHQALVSYFWRHQRPDLIPTAQLRVALAQHCPASDEYLSVLDAIRYSSQNQGDLHKLQHMKVELAKALG